jgi:hypothetical protein
MKTLNNLLILCILLLFFSCSEDNLLMSEFDSSRISGANNGNGEEAGVITAGEWNDLYNWDFWDSLLIGQDSSDMPAYWDIYTNNRISVQIVSSGTPVINAKVELIRNDAEVWTARTDNSGMVELWIGMFQKEDSINLDDFSIKVDDELIYIDLNFIADDINIINISSSQDEVNRVEISFIVDATGSMSDELEFLKADLKSVIEKVQNGDSDIEILTSTVFYRDEGDKYVIRKSEFSSDLNNTIDFISNQSADGGGDFPEAVHTALNAGINELQWSTNARTRIAFLMLDAPPHYTNEIVESIHITVAMAAEKGIKIIPITASGIDKETEFLMRFISILTNGTYVFITNDSGVGNDHLEASVGEYQVEYLNDLIVRLINKYSE